MTLIVSLRIPDGIVIAGDSLSTMMSQVDVHGEVNVTCPQCNHQHVVGPLRIGQINMPSTTYSFAQKVFPFMGDYGIGTFGQGQLMGKTMYFAIRELENRLISEERVIATPTEAAEVIGQYVLDLVRRQVTDIDQAADDWYAVGFLIAGYDGSEAKTIVANIGKSVRTKVYSDAGCTLGGQGHVVNALWQLSKQRPEDQAQYNLFSLQDAIAYAEFLIGTTAAYQKFSRTIPHVGGDIDIALLTPFDKFKWIKQKPLTQLMEGTNG